MNKSILTIVALVACLSCTTSTKFASPDLLKSYKYKIVVNTHRNDPFLLAPYSEESIEAMVRSSFGSFLDFVEEEESEDQEIILFILIVDFKTIMENLGESDIGHTARFKYTVTDLELMLRGPTPDRGNTLWAKARVNRKYMSDAISDLSNDLRKYIER